MIRFTRLITACILLAWSHASVGQDYCPPSTCQTGCGVGIGVSANRWSAVARPPLVPVVRKSSVVVVFVGDDPSPASGIYVGTIHGQGIVLTCLHIAKHGVRAVAGVRPIDIHKCKLGYDLAALIVLPLNVPVAVLGTPPRPGGTVEIIGFPHGRFGRHRGRVLGRFRPDENQPWGDLSIDTASQDGDSGGAVMDADGNLIGMIWGTRADNGQGSAAVPVEAIADFLRRLEIVLGGKTDPAEPVELNTPPIPVPEPTADCDDLRILIQRNAEAIAALAAVARVPGPPGESPTIDYETLAAEVVQHLPHVRLQTVNADGVVIKEASAPLGQPLKLRLVPVGAK